MEMGIAANDATRSEAGSSLGCGMSDVALGRAGDPTRGCRVFILDADRFSGASFGDGGLWLQTRVRVTGALRATLRDNKWLGSVQPICMSNTAPQLESLIHSLKTGTPRAAYVARQQLIGLGRVAEAPLRDLLTEVKDSHRILDVLAILQEVKLSNPASVDSVVRLLSHKETFVRRAAANCLLVSSPKLRRVLARIRVAHAAEKDEGVLATLGKLLDRYPGGAA